MRTKFLAIIVGIGAVLLTGVVADASIPGPNGVINSCVGPVGQVRVIDSADICKNGETGLNWNQTGPQGPQGNPGPTGPTGPQGPSGVSGYNIVTALEPDPCRDGTDRSQCQSRITAHCPTGQSVLGGGAVQFGTIMGPFSFNSVGQLVQDSTAWTAEINTTANAGNFTVYAICANVTS